MMRRPTVLIADDHRMVAEALKEILKPGFDVLGIAEDGMALLEMAPPLKPDIILIDIGMPLLNGLDAGRELRRLLPKAKLVYLTMNDHAQLVGEAFHAGASGYLLKHSAVSELSVCLGEVLKGNQYVSPAIAGKAMEYAAQRPQSGEAEPPSLTPRQRQIVQLVAEGKTMKEIGALLGISPRTVAEHKYHVMELLLLKSNAELVQYAIKNRMVSL
jgi:DNA-binding NarL/FixJ family response regulator